MRLHKHRAPSVKAVSLSRPSSTPSFLQNGFEPVGQAASMEPSGGSVCLGHGVWQSLTPETCDSHPALLSMSAWVW